MIAVRQARHWPTWGKSRSASLVLAAPRVPSSLHCERFRLYGLPRLWRIPAGGHAAQVVARTSRHRDSPATQGGGGGGEPRIVKALDFGQKSWHFYGPSPFQPANKRCVGCVLNTAWRLRRPGSLVTSVQLALDVAACWPTCTRNGLWCGGGGEPQVSHVSN